MGELKELEWKTLSVLEKPRIERSRTGIYSYTIAKDLQKRGMFKVFYYNMSYETILQEDMFTTVEYAKIWCFKNLKEQLLPYFK